VLWQEIVFSGGSHGGEMLFAHSRDRGRTFSTPINLSRSRAGDGKGRIDRDHWHNGSFDLVVADDETVHVAWTAYEGTLWHARSTDGGTTFSAPQRLAGGEGEKPARAPSLAPAAGGTLFVAWTVGEDDSADVRLAVSRDGGRSFGPATIVHRTRGYSDAPKLAVDRHGTLHVAYAESERGPFDRFDVCYARSRDAGATFEAPRVLSGGERRGSATFASLASDGDRTLCVSWETSASASDPPRGLALACSTDAGDTFSQSSPVPASADPDGGTNGSHQGRLMRKLAIHRTGRIAIAQSSLLAGRNSRVWLLRGQLLAPRGEAANRKVQAGDARTFSSPPPSAAPAR
jgi:hypothetical protein